MWKRAIETGEPFYCEHRFRRSDGEYRWHVSRAHAMRNADGGVLMWIGSNTEVHDAKQLADERAALLEAERVARDEAERASRLKDDFLATLPAAALTAFAKTEDRQRALRAGFRHHISKPVESSELVTIVASLAGRVGKVMTE